MHVSLNYLPHPKRPEAYKETQMLFGQLVGFAVQKLEKPGCHIEQLSLFHPYILSKRKQEGPIEDIHVALAKAESDQVKIWYRVSEHVSLICQKQEPVQSLRESREIEMEAEKRRREEEERRRAEELREHERRRAEQLKEDEQRRAEKVAEEAKRIAEELREDEQRRLDAVRRVREERESKAPLWRKVLKRLIRCDKRSSDLLPANGVH